MSWQWCTRCERFVLCCRRRDFGSRGGVPAAGDGGAGRRDHGVRSGRPAGRRAAHRAGGRTGDRRRCGGVRRASTGGAGVVGRAGPGRQADRHHGCAAADLQPGRAASDAAGHPQRHPRPGIVADRAGGRRDDRAHGRRTHPSFHLAPRLRSGSGRSGRRPVRRAGGGAFRRPAVGRRLRRIRRHHRCAFGRADAGRGAGPRRAQPHRRGARGAAAAHHRFGVRRRRRGIRGAAGRAHPASRHPVGAGGRRADQPLGSRGGDWSTTRVRAGMPTWWCWRFRRRGCPR